MELWGKSAVIFWSSNTRIYNEEKQQWTSKNTQGRYFTKKSAFVYAPCFLSPFLVSKKRHEKMSGQNVSGTKLDYRKRGIQIFSVMAG